MITKVDAPLLLYFHKCNEFLFLPLSGVLDLAQLTSHASFDLIGWFGHVMAAAFRAVKQDVLCLEVMLSIYLVK